MMAMCSSSAAFLTPITFGGDEKLPALVGGPKGAPAVIVIQEWWGLTDQIKATAEKLSKLGEYRVLVPDIYKGEQGVDAEEAHHLMSNLDFPKAVEEIGVAAAYLKDEGSPKVGIVGFCMGGALTMGGLAKSPDLSCGAPFYGVNFDLFDDAALAKKPVQGHFGALDKVRGSWLVDQLVGWLVGWLVLVDCRTYSCRGEFRFCSVSHLLDGRVLRPGDGQETGGEAHGRRQRRRRDFHLRGRGARFHERLPGPVCLLRGAGKDHGLPVLRRCSGGSGVGATPRLLREAPGREDPEPRRAVRGAGWCCVGVGV